MRVNREIDARVPHVEDPPRRTEQDVVRIRDDWRLGHTARWPYLCVRKLRYGKQK